MKGEYTEKCNMINNVLIKNRQFANQEGEVVEIHNQCLENLVCDIVEILENEDDKNSKSEKVKEILEKKANQTEFQKELIDIYGSFYFNFYKRFDSKIEIQYIVRFLYLCTFLNYDNYLSDGYRLIKEDKLEDILKLGRREYYKTKSVLIEHDLIKITDDNNILVNNKLCKKGKINKTKSIEVVRMFKNAIKDLYEKSTPREHKKIGILIEMLPYINYKYNVVCSNPEEQNIELVKPMTLKDICIKLGYSESYSSKIKKKLLSMTVNGKYVIKFSEIYTGKSIWVNPRVYYKGNYDGVIPKENQNDNNNRIDIADMFELN